MATAAGGLFLHSPQAKNGLYIFKGLFKKKNVIESTCLKA